MPEHDMALFMKHIEDALAEEAKDSDKYITMASIAPDKYKPILLDISKEEGIHRMHLATMLQDMKTHMALSGVTPEK